MRIGPANGALSCVITAGDLTSRNFSAKCSGTLRLVSRCANLGASMIQIREKSLPGRLLLELVSEAVRQTAGTDTRILVNGRFDVALAAGAHGVHLTSTSIPVHVVRRETPQGFLIGVSTHSLAELLLARDEGADYAVFGPVFETPGKTDIKGPKGIEALCKVCAGVAPFPVLALGGVDTGNYRLAIAAGAAGVAAIRLFNNLKESERILRKLSGNGRQASN